MIAAARLRSSGLYMPKQPAPPARPKRRPGRENHRPERAGGPRPGSRRPGGHHRRAAGSRGPRPSGLRPPRLDVVDAVVLEVYGLVHDQGWLADRALERALRRERKMWANERRLAAESLYGLLRMQGQLRVPRHRRGAGRPGARAHPGGALRGLAGPVRRRGRGRGCGAAGGAGLRPAVAGRRRRADRRARGPAPPPGGGGIAAALDRGAVRGRAGRGRGAAAGARPQRARPAHRAGQRAPRRPRRAAGAPGGGGRRGRADALLALGAGARRPPERLRAAVLPGGAVRDPGRGQPADRARLRGARPGKVVVDACAGAGGKSLALAAEMHNKGSLWALDSDAGRLARPAAGRGGPTCDNLRTRAIPAGAEAAGDARRPGGQGGGGAGGRALQRPGTLRRKPDARWRLKPEDPTRFAALQRELLGRFAGLVAPGGRLVYATCAMGRTENGDVAAFAEPRAGARAGAARCACSAPSAPRRWARTATRWSCSRTGTGRMGSSSRRLPGGPSNVDVDVDEQ